MTEHDNVSAENLTSISNEFATVEVRRVETPKGDLLELSSPVSGDSIRLDAVALESLTWQDDDHFTELIAKHSNTLGTPDEDS